MLGFFRCPILPGSGPPEPPLLFSPISDLQLPTGQLPLLSVAFERVPELDEERVAILESSRGGVVPLLAAVRDRRIDAVVEFFGPTDFFGEYAHEIFEEALEGELRDLPDLEYFNETGIQPVAHVPGSPTALGCPSGPRCATSVR